jgi:hypothetical protein
MLIVGGTYINKHFVVLLGGLMFVYGYLRVLAFSMSHLLYGQPYFSFLIFKVLVKRIEHIYINVYFPSQMAFHLYEGGK